MSDSTQEVVEKTIQEAAEPQRRVQSQLNQRYLVDGKFSVTNYDTLIEFVDPNSTDVFDIVEFLDWDVKNHLLYVRDDAANGEISFAWRDYIPAGYEAGVELTVDMREMRPNYTRKIASSVAVKRG